ncbi:MAG: glycosyltransferase [Terracidiphilus sp.]
MNNDIAPDSEDMPAASQDARPAVIIVGPPWPRSGTARVMQNQIDYYRNRGYLTVFICVPLHCSYTKTHPGWNDIKVGIRELGADYAFFAPIDNLRFVGGKYVAWARHSFRGTLLDWIVFTARSARLPDDVVQFIRELPVALVHVNHVFTLGFAQRLLRTTVRSGHSIPIVLETHDIQSNAMKDWGEINPWTHRRDTHDNLLRSEVAHLSTVKVLVHVSIEDFDFFKSRLPHKCHVLAMPTIDEAFVADVDVSRQSSNDSVDLLFVGHSTPPNVAAVQWFFEQVWPLIDHCGYRLKIVGEIQELVRKELPAIYQAFCSHFVGPVAELTPAYRAARCVFAPMVSGTGISIKTIEALALGKPFVGTSKAFRGIPIDQIQQAGLRAHDTPQDFADAIAHALSSQELAASASRAAYTRLFSRQASFSSRDEALKIAGQKRNTL